MHGPYQGQSPPMVRRRAGQEPWHLWGNSQVIATPTFTIPAGDATAVTSAPGTEQLIKASYLRPDTWHFLFQAQLAQVPPASDIAPFVSYEVDVFFDLIVGIGRSMIQLPSFAKLSWLWTTEPAPIGEVLYRTRVSGPTDDNDGTLATEITDEITAQNIQCVARVTLTATRGSTDFPQTVTPANVMVSAQVAPKTHIRPEWFLNHFPGGEQGQL